MVYSDQIRDNIGSRDNRPRFYEEVVEEIKRCYPLEGQTTAFLITLILINVAYNIIR